MNYDFVGFIINFHDSPIAEVKHYWAIKVVLGLEVIFKNFATSSLFCLDEATKTGTTYPGFS